MEQVLLQLAKVFGMRKAMQILGISSESELGQVISGGGFGGSLGLTSPTEGQGIVSNLMSPSNALRLASNQLTGGGSLPSIGGLGGVLGVAALPLLMEPYREQLTGFATQEEYEQDRQKNINIDRIDMRSDPKTLENLEINLKKEGLNDKEIKDRINQFKGETTKLKAEVVGADIFNPSEMKNLDETFENVKYDIDPTWEEPSLTGEIDDTNIVNVDAVKAAIEKSKAEQKQIEEIQKRADKAAIPDVITLPTKETAPVIKPKVIAVSAPSQYREPSGGQQHDGGGGGAAAQARGDVSGGSWRSSPFKHGGISRILPISYLRNRMRHG